MTSELSHVEQELLAKLEDRNWRLNNLYWIENERGQKVKFRMNWAQRAFLAAMWWLNVILKARQLGMSTFIEIYILDLCLFSKNRTCGIIDKGDKDATKKLAKIRFAYDNLDCDDPSDGPSTAALGAMIKRDVRLTADNDHELEWSNDSKVWSGTSLRGGTIQFLHVSELGYIAANFPKKAQEIRSGAFNTVHEGSVIVIESTHEGGKTGLNYEMIVTAQEAPAKLSILDWKFHFFAWWQDPKYTLKDPQPVTDVKMIEYFSELQVKHGILLSPGQQAWYAGKERSQREAMKKEFPSTADEAVNAVIKGAIYGQDISRARAEGRVCEFNLEPGMPIYCSWDIGVSDFADLWFVQPVGLRDRVFDFYENNGFGAAHYVDYVRAWEQLHGVKIHLHILPHDAASRNFGSSDGNGKSMSVVQTLVQLGLKNVVVVPRTPDIWIGINRLRAMMPNMVFHSVNCQKDRMKEGRRYPSGLGALESYHTHDDSTSTVIKEMPVHDDSSHPADGLRTFAEGRAAGMVSTFGSAGEQPRHKVTVNRGREPREDDVDDDLKDEGFSGRRLRSIRVKK